ncbi:Protein of unknown function [Carnobacterium alterfunditum]|uniref:Uncharacterized protein n=1 Tax=Carnobacterium alterfunditum TaxID=28230 RepID=A0A1N6HL49_9LACT|nr:hypothetical protein [Carnobacterium alterfunditum]SIO20477.1 Protein of unknown function [Carnobacterium alterfunditum]
MIKNGLFTIAIGFVVVILGLTDFEGRQILMLGIGILLIILGFALYNKGEKKAD